MKMKVLSILFIAAAMSVPAYGGQDYTVTLTNGNTLTANSYRLEGHKVYLKYPVGEVAIPASEVAAVASGNGAVELLQVQGELKPSQAGDRETAAQQAAVQGQTGAGHETAAQSSAGPGNQGATGRTADDRVADGRDRRAEAISGAVSGATPSGGGGGSVFGGVDTDYDPAADALTQQLSTADDDQVMELTKKLTEQLVGPADAGASAQK